MHPKRILVGSLVLLAWALPAAAQLAGGPQSNQSGSGTIAQPVDTPLTLEKAVDMAFAVNPTLRTSALDVVIASAERRQAGLLPNPSISYMTEGTQRGTRTRTFELSQLVELGGKRRARIELAERESRLALAASSVARADLRADVIAAYFNALGAQERVKLAQTSLDIASKARSAAEKRVAAGRVSPVELSRATVAESTARLDLSQADGELRIAHGLLAAYWGQAQPGNLALIEPADDLGAIPSLDVLRTRLAGSPQLQRARLQVEREEAQVSVDRAQRMPDITLVVGRQKDEEMGRSQTVLGVSVPLPLFNRNQGNLQASLARADKARAESDAQRLRLDQALSSTYQRAQLAREQVRTMRQEILPEAQRVFDAAVIGFEAGKFNFLDVLDAQRTLLQSRAQYVQAVYDSYRFSAELGRFADSGAGATNNNRMTP
ncbi:TolC family protein [Massilia alkalitolerans]|uniref:TolC family protein n=1 Tax=Massilia alkalitolerans TaxID=286638 RepID=UPI000486E39D|nr:TolC family protein [Massilia alkalitolerans]